MDRAKIEGRVGYLGRIFIIDPDDIFGGTLAAAIEKSKPDYRISHIQTWDIALSQARKHRPELILVDILGFGVKGIGSLKMLRSVSASTKVIVIADDHRGQVLDVFRLGASGFILKTLSLEQIIQQVDQVLAGEIALSQSLLGVLVEKLQLSADSPLTRRETEILTFLARGYTYTEIAEKLIISKDTARAHIRNIYSKLQVQSKSEAIRVAMQNKYI